MVMKLNETNHSYYCSDSGYSGNEAEEYDTWAAFKDNFLDKYLKLDHDLDLCFRYDILKYSDRFELDLFFIQQHRGRFYPVVIKNITKADMPEITQFLKSVWEYHKNQWAEINQL